MLLRGRRRRVLEFVVLAVGRLIDDPKKSYLSDRYWKRGPMPKLRSDVTDAVEQADH